MIAINAIYDLSHNIAVHRTTQDTVFCYIKEFFTKKLSNMSCGEIA